MSAIPGITMDNNGVVRLHANEDDDGQQIETIMVIRRNADGTGYTSAVNIKDLFDGLEASGVIG